MKLARNIIIALIAGVVVGLVLNIFTPGIFTQADAFLFKPLGTIFLNLMKMLVVCRGIHFNRPRNGWNW